MQLGPSEAALCELGFGFFLYYFTETFAYSHEHSYLLLIKDSAGAADFPFGSRSEAMRGNGACASVARIDVAIATFRLTCVKRQGSAAPD